MEILKDPKAYFAAIALKDKYLKFEMYVSGPMWFTKAGKLRKNDITNRIKIFEDVVMDTLGIDDSCNFTFEIHKVVCKNTKTVCKITVLEDYLTEIPI